jgi:hypothetical protein
MSFLFSGPASQVRPVSGEKAKARIISDSFRLNAAGGKNAESGSWGRYGCSERGLVLLTGSRESVEASHSGALEEIAFNGTIDAKSGALVVVKKHAVKKH